MKDKEYYDKVWEKEGLETWRIRRLLFSCRF